MTFNYTNSSDHTFKAPSLSSLMRTYYAAMAETAKVPIEIKVPRDMLEHIEKNIVKDTPKHMWFFGIKIVKDDDLPPGVVRYVYDDHCVKRVVGFTSPFGIMKNEPS